MKNTCIIFVLFIFFFYSCNTNPIDTLEEGIETQNIEKIKTALKDIPDINLPLKNGEISLSRVIEIDNIDIVKTLINKGAIINPINGNSLIFSAMSTDMVEFLLKEGASANAKDSVGNTLLHISKKPQVIKILLEQKADINQQNDQGETPLMNAAASGKTDLFTLFLEHGADAKIKDKKGKTAVDHILPNSDLSTYWAKEEERRAREAKKRKQEEEEKQRKIALKNAFPAKGKTGYICNYGTACQVLIKEVAGGKVKVEILEKCWPRNMNTMNLSKALDPGNIRWLNKNHVRKKRGTCY